MKKLLLLTLSLIICRLAIAQVVLGPSPYTQDFNAIGSALPAGITVRTGATATALGTPATLTTAPTAWSNTTGAFKNLASATGLTADAATAAQAASANRSLGVRQTSAVGDPNGAFVLQLANTTGLKDFKLAFKLQSLDASSPRVTTWRVDYGFGASPTAFTAATATGTLTTGGSAFTSNAVTVDFGNALDNKPGDVWIRIVTLTASTGSGNRATSAIDDLSLTYSSGAAVTPTLSANPASVAFGTQAVGTRSAAQSYTISYANLDGSDVMITAAAPFSIAKSAAGPFSASLDYSAAELSGSSLTVYTEFSPTGAGGASGTITHTGGGISSPVTVSVTGTGISQNPVASPDTYAGSFGDVVSGNVSLNDTDPQNLALTFAKLTDPAAGVLTFNADGSFAYQSVTGAAATQTFTYRATNMQGLSATGTVTITLAEKSKIFISQYYEGTSTNKWIELTNPTDMPVNTASPQLKLALYSISGDAGTITIAGAPQQTVNLSITIPAKSSVLIGNSGNGTEVPYLTANGAHQVSNAVINFNGNDGIALLDAAGTIIDAFGSGINAKDVSYVRNADATAPSATFDEDEWTRVTLATVQNAADLDDPDRLGVHVQPDLPDCAVPSAQPSALVFTATGTRSISLAFSASPDAGEYLVVRSLNPALSASPVDGTVYDAGSAFGGGTIAGRITGTAFTDQNLPSGTTFYYFIYALNSISCDGGPKYLANNPLSGSSATVPLPACAAPISQPTAFHVTFSNYNVIQGTFTPANGADEFLVIMSKDSMLTALPQDQHAYTVGDSIGGGIVVKRGAQGTFSRSGLAQKTDYFFYLFSVNGNCSGGPLYLTASPLTGRQRTDELNANALNYYFGNLHSHSSYSDGNKDDLTKKPEDDYAFAKNSMNMDFLGISEHNHTQAGMRLSYWDPGIQAAKNATTPTFVALHGMEWGVISGGGHVVVYGIDSLIGWEPGEYQVYVPKSTYTGPNGLFNVINRHGLNAIATLAHPNTSDFNNISAAYNAQADSAVVGAALESGPAFSTNVTYSDPASSMSYLSYYNRMLARGYHLGATVDHDNHNLTFGRHTRARLVILAPALTENDLLDGMKRMRFYASEDSAARISFTINGQPVGSIFAGNGYPNISVTGSTTSPVSKIELLAGTPGNGNTPAVLYSTNSGTVAFTDSTLSHLATGYYYASITENDGSRIITSPIWYTRNDSIKTAQTITFNSLPAKTYGDADFDPAATSSNSSIPVTYASGDTSVATIVNGKVHILKAGTVSITAQQAGNPLYRAATPKSQSLTIAKKVLGVSADDKSRLYGNPNPSLTLTYQGFVDGDSLAALTAQPQVTTTAADSSSVGTYPIVVSGGDAVNYSFNYTDGTLTVTPAGQVITFNAPAAKTFGDADFDAAATSTNPLVPVTYASSDANVATIVNGKIHILNAGNTIITAAQAADVNHSVAESVSRELVVNKAAAVLTLGNLSQTFDGMPKSVTVTTNPPALTGVAVTYNASQTAPVAAGNYNVVATLTNANYTAPPVSGTLVVAQPLIVKVQYRNGDSNPANNQASPYLKLVNAGPTAVPYAQLTMRYWITPENFAGLATWIDYAQLGANKVSMTYVALASPRVKALGYVEYSFNATAGTLAAGANSGDIQSRFANADWSVFNELNDHSYGSNTAYADAPNITLYRNGTLIWGTEPAVEATVVSLKAYSSSANNGNNTIGTYLDIRNEGNVAVDYKDVTARYWFTADGSSALGFWIDYAKIGNTAITGNFVAVSPARVNADKYLEIRMRPSASTLYPLSATGNIQYRVSKSDWSNFVQTNDHSYKAGASMTENPKITIYYKGQLVYGTEPAASGTTFAFAPDLAAKTLVPVVDMRDAGTMVYPNPSTGNFTLQLNDGRTGPFKAVIYDAAGKAIDTFAGQSTGKFSRDYRLALTKGSYYLVVSWAGHTDYRTILIN